MKRIFADELITSKVKEQVHTPPHLSKHEVP